MSAIAQPTGSGSGGVLGGISDIVESLGSVYIQSEQIRNGVPVSGYTPTNNTTSDFPRVETGVDSDGSTLQAEQYVPGVKNTHLFAGVALLAAVGILAAVLD